MNTVDALYGSVAGILGLFLGFSELINRYNSFNKIFKNIYSWIYVLINFVASFAAYSFIKIYKVNIGALGEHSIGLIIFSGLGAMAFLRSSFFNYKTSNGQVVAVGPAAILSVFLRAAESEFDRIISNDNVKFAADLMRGIPFVSASKDLPLIILGSMRALNSEEQKTLSDDILKLVNDINPNTEAKNIAMCALLIKYTGYDLLTTSIRALKDI
ncbi:MAG TPA: hypothetical protein VHD83_22480 [Puia sp.]|nr:hypothetical protein [Puia sp.]